MLYGNSYRSDSDYKSGDFVLSSVNSADLKKYGITGTVKDFKAKVKKSKNYKVIVTGGAGHSCHTRIYNYNDFVNQPQVQPSGFVSFDYWWNRLWLPLFLHHREKVRRVY